MTVVVFTKKGDLLSEKLLDFFLKKSLWNGVHLTDCRPLYLS